MISVRPLFALNQRDVEASIVGCGIEIHIGPWGRAMRNAPDQSSCMQLHSVSVCQSYLGDRLERTLERYSTVGSFPSHQWRVEAPRHRRQGCLIFMWTCPTSEEYDVVKIIMDNTQYTSPVLTRERSHVAHPSDT